jgi:hypothetical protein
MTDSVSFVLVARLVGLPRENRDVASMVLKVRVS